MLSVATLLGITASVLGLYAVIPQVLRARRTASVDGISWSGQVLGLLTAVLWATYGFAILDEVQILNNLAALALNVALAAVIVRLCPETRWVLTVVVLLAAGATAVAAALTLSPLLVAGVATAIGAVRMVPQVKLVLSGAPLWGLDPWGVQLSLGSALLWIAYGITMQDPAVIVSAGIFAAMQTIVCARRLPPRRTLMSLAGGRLGPHVALAALPLHTRFGHQSPA